MIILFSVWMHRKCRAVRHAARTQEVVVSDKAEPGIGHKEHVAMLRPRAPRRLNALTHGARGLLDLRADGWANLAADPRIRAVVLATARRPFCARAHSAGLARAREICADEQPHTYPRLAARHLTSRPRLPASVGPRHSKPVAAIADADLWALVRARLREAKWPRALSDFPRETKR
jgi:enoyl-CoA hydratase/carnithine racemase